MKLFRILSLMTIALTLGCIGGSELPEGDTGTVTGTLKLDGGSAPEGVSVIFLPKSKGLAASGTVDASGAFTMMTRGEKDIMAGDYYVGVTPPTTEMTPEQQAAANDGTYEEPTYDIPELYLVPESSGISFTVKAGENTFDLDMKK